MKNISEHHVEKPRRTGEVEKIKELLDAQTETRQEVSNALRKEADGKLAARLEGRTNILERELEKQARRLEETKRFSKEVQTEQISEFVNSLDELKPEEWQRLSLDQRTAVLQKIEDEAARVGGRSALQIQTEYLPTGLRGATNWKEGRIVMNRSLVESNERKDLRQAVKTLVHEGRHVYQLENVFGNAVEPNSERLASWEANLKEGEYMQSQKYGYRLYYMQPVEVDARTFSEDVLARTKL